ncbi:response regulator transcription factor [Microbacterium sp. ASV49]|uniref:Helix-turn-helix transcriptional regulator n=1 Tax=Microbacterium candidum TaxID=3041922 RepID=A0ABT7N3J7_9MICO|nr:helix-turn-helix transcriptional regulator [Microbacterium sp. ASV49]MDL9981279.1 helix-turn-helix transcriptional regulator [Microbacterium sp. ASV49]
MVGSGELASARDGIEQLSRARMRPGELLREAAAVVQQVVPSVAGCLATLDPATAIITGVAKEGALAGHNEADAHWAQIEYGGDDPTAMRTLVVRRRTAVGVRNEFGGEAERSLRMAELLVPQFGFHDEARVVFADSTGAWGSMAMFRGSDDPAFAPDEVDFLAAIAPAMTRGIRSGLLADPVDPDAEPVHGSGVIILDATDRVVRTTPWAQEQLARLAPGPVTVDPLTIVHSLVGRVRRSAGDPTAPPARVRVRATDGSWLVLCATPLNGGHGEDVVVTIEEARPHDVVDLVAAAFGLTLRERDVVDLVLRGSDTRTIASRLHLSPYTVQDHLKAIFDKAGVASRGQLVARVYFDHYEPRLAVP